MDKTTGAMKSYGTPASPNRGGPLAGLLLLYAEYFVELPSVWLLDRESLVIGRDESADIRIPADAVSRKHAEVRWENDGWVLRDLGSRG